MRTVIQLLMLCALAGGDGESAGSKTLRLQPPTLANHAHPNDLGSLCLGSVARQAAGEICPHRYPVEIVQPTRVVTVKVKEICKWLSEKADTNAEPIWTARGSQQPQKILYRLNCQKNLSYPPEPVTADAGAQPPRHQEKPSPAKDPRAGEGGATAELRRRVEALSREQGTLNQRLNRIQQRLETLEESHHQTCARADGQHFGRREVTVNVEGVALRFLEIEPGAAVTIGLDEAVAHELYREAQQGRKQPIPPWILRSVPAVERQVPPFLLQDRLLDSRLYERLGGQGSVDELSFDAASGFLKALNERCSGVARFELPTEEQLTAAVKLVYDPVRIGLMPCAALAGRGRPVQLDQLVGQAWQLTRSLCEPFAPQAEDYCEPGFYVRKGGAATSENPLECVPEYRGITAPDIAQKATSLRLVLSESR